MKNSAFLCALCALCVSVVKKRDFGIRCIPTLPSDSSGTVGGAGALMPASPGV